MGLIVKAAAILRQGGVVAFPTETVYGLGARAFDEHAVHQIFALKKRPPDNPLIVHIAHQDQLRQLSPEIPALAVKLMSVFWPGPLTLVFKRLESVPALISAGLPTIAVRMPRHPMALALIRALGEPIAAPSANRSGRISPTSADHVRKEFGDTIPMILDGGPCTVGLESTVINVTSDPPRIFRPGTVTCEAIASVIGKVLPSSDNSPGDKEAAISPGLKHQHYTPRLEMILVEPGQWPRVEASLHTPEKRQGVITLQHKIDAPWDYCKVMHDLTDYAKNLFSAIHEAEAVGIERLFVEGVPKQGLGVALMDRLERGAHRILQPEEQADPVATPPSNGASFFTLT